MLVLPGLLFKERQRINPSKLPPKKKICAPEVSQYSLKQGVHAYEPSCIVFIDIVICRGCGYEVYLWWYNIKDSPHSEITSGGESFVV